MEVKSPKKHRQVILFAAMLTFVTLGFLIFLFAGNVKKQLWEHSFGIINVLERLMGNYMEIDSGISLYLPEGECFPGRIRPDWEVEAFLENEKVQNLFEILALEEIDPDSMEKLRQSLKSSDTGCDVFKLQEEKMVFCHTPPGKQSDWCFATIIPQKAVNAQSDKILLQSMLLIVSIMVGICALVAVYYRSVRRTSQRLGSQAAYIEHLYNAVPEGVALITVETPYRLLQINREGHRLLACPPNEDRNQQELDIIKDVIYFQDSRKMQDIFADTAQTGRKNIFESRVLRRDGSCFWAGGIVEKIQDENGVPVFIATFHDITKEKLAAEAAKRQQMQERTTLLGAISNAYPLIISINLTSDEIDFIYVKPGLLAELGNQRTFSELYRDVAAMVHPDDEKEYQKYFSRDSLCRVLGREKKDESLEMKQMLTDGKYHWVSVQIIYVDDPYTDDLMAILISRCIDEQKHKDDQQREALKGALEGAMAANRAKSQFLSNMSHDIRTPMNAVIGMTAIAMAHVDDRERVLECLNKISISSRHLLSLINDVLDMSKIESGKVSMREEPFNFAELMTDLIELVKPQADEKNLGFEFNMEVLKNENVTGDSLRIQQVCVNILSNAVKYTNPGGNVRIFIWQEDSVHGEYRNYIFKCEDTGIGMSSEFIGKLFQPFERAQDSTSSRIAGTGLGMAITKNIVDLLNGEIQVESTPGEGSAFTVTIPLRVQDAPAEEIAGQWKGVRGLIAGGEEDSCRSVTRLLEDLELKMDCVAAEGQVLQRIRLAKEEGEEYRIIILDWSVPDIGGADMVRRIRKETGVEVPIVVLTANDGTENETEARLAGVSGFLAKPLYRSKICGLLNTLGEERAPETTEPVEEPDYSGMRLLLVEDNEINREIARELIEGTGLKIEEACDGEEAVRKVAESGEGYYDLIFMDIQMPKMDGYEATRKIRAMKREDAAKIPIIAMTANVFEEDIRAARRAGMNAHFAKPIDTKALKRLLQQYAVSSSHTKI